MRLKDGSYLANTTRPSFTFETRPPRIPKYVITAPFAVDPR
jgi:hypothetical protein